MQKQLKLVLKPNNQISLFTQWVNIKKEERFAPCPDFTKQPEYIKEYYRNGQAKFERERKKTHETIRVKEFNADGSHSYNLLRIPMVPDRNKAVCGRNLPPLDITKKSQRAIKTRTGWGIPNKPKRFTNKSGQHLRECGAMVDKLTWGNPSLCRVITLTLPANTHESFQAIASHTAYLINGLFQPVRTASFETAWFFVWEYQKRGALHLHICLYSDRKSDSEKLGMVLIEQWYKMLGFIQDKTGIEMFATGNGSVCQVRKYEAKCLNQEMRKSCGGYFSKYAAKGENIPQNDYVKKFSEMYPVSRFWGSSAKIKDMCRKYSFTKLLSIRAEEIEQEKENILELILRFNPVKFNEYEWKKYLNKGTDRECVISEGECKTFYLPPARYEELLNMLNDQARGVVCQKA